MVTSKKVEFSSKTVMWRRNILLALKVSMDFAQKDYQMKEWQEKIEKAREENAEYLDLDCAGIRKISVLSSLSSLKRLHLRNCQSIEDFGSLCLLSSLEELFLSHGKNDAYDGTCDRTLLKEERKLIIEEWGKYCYSLIDKEKISSNKRRKS